ncbi:MAG: hypothetical protein HQ567_12345 [Candidatus Nealsonbacteria bacterium]|nr:hypothetical protein [Candidatus Nealsonbacteria bacterium]
MESGDPFHLLDVLSCHDVPFVIIGGHAVTYHGFVRATEDTDVVFQRTPESESALLDALTEINACWIGDEIDPDTTVERTFPVSLPYIRGNRVMMLVTDFGFLDIFDYIPGCPDEPVEQLFDTAVEHERYRYASLRWLRAMKAAANRPQDQTDLENLPTDP